MGGRWGEVADGEVAYTLGMDILIATTNPGKLREIRAVMNHPSVELLGLDQVDDSLSEPVEDGETFEANAIKKAQHYARLTNLPTIADDSGLEVDALDKKPGVHSARYSGASGSREQVDRANNVKLIEALADVPEQARTARFVCAMAMVTPPGQHFADMHGQETMTVRGTIEGRILLPQEAEDPEHPELGRGRNGFGYDPLFLVPELGQTTAELSSQRKNRISHRGEATRAMWMQLQPLVATAEA